jgi:hypothetical protein
MRVLLTAPMTNRQVFEPVDRTLRDTNGEEQKDLLFGGDFAQTLPVVEKGRRADTLQKAFIWEKLKEIGLDENISYDAMCFINGNTIQYALPVDSQ